MKPYGLDTWRIFVAGVPALVAYAEPTHADVISLNGQQYDVRKDNKVLTLDGKEVQQPDLVTRALQTQDTLDQIREMKDKASSIQLLGVGADLQGWVMEHSAGVETGLTAPAQLLATVLSGGSVAALGKDAVQQAVRDLEATPQGHLKSLALHYYHEVDRRFDENRTLMDRIWKGGELSAEEAERFRENDAFMQVYAGASTTLYRASLNTETLGKQWTRAFLEGVGVDVATLEGIVGTEKPSPDATLLRDFGKNVAKKRKEVDADTVHDRGELLARIGRYQEGFPLLKQATELDPSNPEYWNDLGVTYGRLGKEKDQLVAYDRALEIDPNYGLVLANKCSYFSKGHDWESALFWARRALPHLGKWPSRQMEITSFISATEKHLATLAKK